MSTLTRLLTVLVRTEVLPGQREKRLGQAEHPPEGNPLDGRSSGYLRMGPETVRGKDLRSNHRDALETPVRSNRKGR